MKPHTLITLGFGLLLAVNCPTIALSDDKEEAIKKEWKQFEGDWQLVSAEINGNKVGEQDAKRITVRNEPGRKWVLQLDGKVVARGDNRIDPAKNPKTVDSTTTEGENKGKTQLGIYEISGDSRKVCFVEIGRERPADFTCQPGSGRILAVYKRVKK